MSPYAVKYAQLNKEPTTTDIMLGIKNFMNSENWLREKIYINWWRPCAMFINFRTSFNISRMSPVLRTQFKFYTITFIIKRAYTTLHIYLRWWQFNSADIITCVFLIFKEILILKSKRTPNIIWITIMYFPRINYTVIYRLIRIFLR